MVPRKYLGLFIVIGAALLMGLLVVKLWLPARFLQKPTPQEPTALEYGPVEIDPQIEHRLVVWDYPWPHPDPMEHPDRFLGEQPQLWEDRLLAAATAFENAYPKVKVVVEQHPFDYDWREADDLPDVIAIWWGAPYPSTEQVVPLEPYLTDEIRAEYHPLSWQLQEQTGLPLGWPRWIAFHYWLGAPASARDASENLNGEKSRWQSVIQKGWTFSEVAASLTGEDVLLIPPASPGFWMELAASLQPLEATESMQSADNYPFIAMAELIQSLQPLIPAREHLLAELGRRLIDRDFSIAAGLGPAFLHWAVSGRSADDSSDLYLLPPPVPGPVSTRVPVFSVGTFMVLRKSGPVELQRAQLAMALARHLSRWQPEAAVARLLAFPAHRGGLKQWHLTSSLTEDIRKLLLDDAAYATSWGIRTYGSFNSEEGSLINFRDAGSLYQSWLQGDTTIGDALQQLASGRVMEKPEGID